MAITSSAGDGVRVTSAAKNGTLGSQAGAASNQIIFPSTIATNNGNLMAGPTFVGRLVRIRVNTSTEECRYITAIDGGGTTATVNEDWVVAPANGDAYIVSYIVQDAATLTGLSLVTKRVNDYSLSRRLSIGNAGAASYPANRPFFFLGDGASLEANNNNSATLGDIQIEPDGIFQVGYLQGGAAVSGGAIFGTSSTGTNNLFFQNAQSSAAIAGHAYLYDLYVKSVNRITMSVHAGHNFWKKAKFYNTLNQSILVSSDVNIVSPNSTRNEYDDIVFEAVGNANDYISHSKRNFYFSRGTTLINTNGFLFGSGGTDTTIELRDVTFIRTTRVVSITNGTFTANENIDFVNPSWVIDTATQNSIAYNGTSNNAAVREKFSLDVSVADQTGTAIQNARVYVYEGLTNKDLPNSITTSASGTGTTDILKRVFTNNAGTSLTTSSRGDFALKAYFYAKTPFVIPLTVTAPIDQPISLPDDANVVTGSAATAITNGSGITVTRHATPMNVMHYDGGTSAFSAGQTVTGATSGATGVVVEVIGTTTDGYLVLDTRNGTPFSNNENLQVSAVTYAVADVSGDTNSFYAAYRWEVDCNSLSLQTVYDWQSAKFAQTSPDAIIQDAIEWGEDEHAYLFIRGTNGYETRRNVNLAEGVWLSNRGSGTLFRLQADDGTLWTPPATYTFELTGLQPNTEVRVFNAGTMAEITGVENSGTSFSYNYVYTGDINIYVQLISIGYEIERLSGLTLSNTNQSIPVQQRVDRNYQNP